MENPIFTGPSDIYSVSIFFLSWNWQLEEAYFAPEHATGKSMKSMSTE
ncbi:MAG: hypothetical protein ACI9TH_004359 [Kiritimatiellia bacterium]|jgi:hypothetical protein